MLYAREVRLFHQMAGAASALFLLDIKGRVLIWRDYRGDVSAIQAERFFTKFIEKEVSDSPLSLPLPLSFSLSLYVSTSAYELSLSFACKIMLRFDISTA